MRIDWWTLALQTINLLVLVWLLGRFLLKPLAAAVADRQAGANRLLDEAAAARAGAEAQRAAIVAERQAMAGEKAQAVAAAEAEAQARRETILTAAQADADHARAAAEEDASRRIASAVAEIDKRSSLLSIDITRRLLARAPQLDQPTTWLAGLDQAIADLPEATRARIAAAPVRLDAARALTTEEQATCRAALETALGRPLDLTFGEGPGLIAGLELTCDEAVVRNHLRADLDRIAATLGSGDHG